MDKKPVVALTYGPPKVGKTTDLGFSFPKALFLAAPGALESIETTCGYAPDQVDAKTINDALKVIRQLGSDKGRKYKTVVIDDFSFMAEQTFSELENRKSGYKLWGALRETVLNFRNESRYCGINVILNAWEQPSRWKVNEKTGHKTFHRGGPQLSGNLPEQVPALCDVVLRVGHEPSRALWPFVYLCRPDPAYIMGDRTSVAQQIDPVPFNLGELLRARGHVFERRWPDQEAQIEALVSPHGDEPPTFVGNPAQDNPLAEAMYAQAVDQGADPFRTHWTLRDALDRALIRRSLAESKRSLFYRTAQPPPLALH